MLFELPEDHARFVSRVERIASAELAAGALARAHAPRFPREVAELFARHGLTGIVAGTAEGDRPAGVLAGVLAVEAVARICPRGADAVHQASFASALLLARYGRSERQRELLKAILAGQALVSIAVSEEQAGSQAAALATRARREGEDLVLDGAKRFTANSVEADAFIVYAGFDEGVAAIGAVLVEADTPGLAFGPPTAFMSGESWRALRFEGARLPQEAVIFDGGGFVDKAGFFDIEKLGNGARALGLGWCAFDLAVAHAGERRQFSRPLAEFQGLQWRFAEVRQALEAAQLVLYRAAARADRGALRGEDSSCAKLACNQAAMAAADLAVQALGGQGYSQDGLADYCFRKARGHLINGGVAELMLTRIAEGIFARKFPQQPG